jgi:hypothetical protein
MRLIWANLACQASRQDPGISRHFDPTFSLTAGKKDDSPSKNCPFLHQKSLNIKSLNSLRRLGRQGNLFPCEGVGREMAG